MSDPRFETFKDLLLAYTKPVEAMEAAHHVGSRADWEEAVAGEVKARLALYDHFTACLAAPAPAQDKENDR